MNIITFIRYDLHGVCEHTRHAWVISATLPHTTHAEGSNFCANASYSNPYEGGGNIARQPYNYIEMGSRPSSLGWTQTTPSSLGLTQTGGNNQVVAPFPFSGDWVIQGCGTMVVSPPAPAHAPAPCPRACARPCACSCCSCEIVRATFCGWFYACVDVHVVTAVISSRYNGSVCTCARKVALGGVPDLPCAV